MWNIEPAAAALPPHSAVRLGLTVAASSKGFEAMPPNMRHSLTINHLARRKGRAFPHCAAAKPQ